MNKKRTPTLRRPANAPLHPPIHNDFSRDIKTDAKESKEMSASSIDKIYKDFEANVDDVKAANIDRNSRIDELLNKITAADNNNDSKMGNFKPLEHPSVQVKGDYENAELPKYNPKLPSFAAATIQMRHGDAEYSNYAQSYDPPASSGLQMQPPASSGLQMQPPASSGLQMQPPLPQPKEEPKESIEIVEIPELKAVTPPAPAHPKTKSDPEVIFNISD